MMMLSNYFKERRGFERLFLGLKSKYISLGRYSGSVTLKNITEEEAQTFQNFFRKKFKAGETVAIRFSDITKCLKDTKFADFTWDELFYDYFGKEIIDNKAKKIAQVDQEKNYFQELESLLNPEEKELLENILQDKRIFSIVIKRVRKEGKRFQEDLKWLIHLVSSFETLVPISLVMLASVTGNPHFLDFNTSNNSLFIKLLAYRLEEAEPQTLSERKEFLTIHDISLDDVSNYVITYNLRSSSNLIESFYKEKQILNLNSSNLVHIKDLDTTEKFVIVLENPSLLRELKSLDIPIVITSGIPNSSVYNVLKKLETSGNTLYYNGDFDPEGLIIAEQLKKRFPLLKFFCYSEQDFNNARSSKKVNDSRLHKLQLVHQADLREIKERLLEDKVAGYQEANILGLQNYIENILIKNNKI